MHEKEGDVAEVREMKPDKYRNNRKASNAQYEKGNLLRQLLNQPVLPNSNTAVPRG